MNQVTSRQSGPLLRVVGALFVVALTGCPNLFSNYSLFGDGVEINPRDTYLVATATVDFSAFGGRGPYRFSVQGIGTVDAASGLFTAPSLSGFATVTVTDDRGGTDSTMVTVLPLSPPAIDPPSVVAYHGALISFYGVGGLGPYTFSVPSGAGSISSLGGLYTAPGGDTTAVVRVVDALGNEAEASVQIVAAGTLVINPPTLTVDEYASVPFAASGGSPAYTFSVFAGAGSVNPTTGDFSPAGAGVRSRGRGARQRPHGSRALRAAEMSHRPMSHRSPVR